MGYSIMSADKLLALNRGLGKYAIIGGGDVAERLRGRH